MQKDRPLSGAVFNDQAVSRLPVGNFQSTSTARTADAESAAVADDVRATIRDASQFLSTQRAAAERVFRCCKASAQSMERSSPSQATVYDQRIRCILSRYCCTVGAGGSSECCTGSGGHHFHHY